MICSHTLTLGHAHLHAHIHAHFHLLWLHGSFHSALDCSSFFGNFFNLVGVIFDFLENVFSIVGQSAYVWLAVFWFIERFDLGELSAEDEEFITCWLEDLTLELEENLSLTFDLSSLTHGIFLGSVGSDESWEYES